MYKFSSHLSCSQTCKVKSQSLRGLHVDAISATHLELCSGVFWCLLPRCGHCEFMPHKGCSAAALGVADKKPELDCGPQPTGTGRQGGECMPNQNRACACAPQSRQINEGQFSREHGVCGCGAESRHSTNQEQGRIEHEGELQYGRKCR